MRVLLVLFSLVCCAIAAAPDPWPDADGRSLEFVDTPAEKLPKGINFEEISIEGREPHKVGICWIDLNRDGKPELLVDSHEGGTGGSYFSLLHARAPDFGCSQGGRAVSSYSFRGTATPKLRVGRPVGVEPLAGSCFAFQETATSASDWRIGAATIAKRDLSSLGAVIQMNPEPHNHGIERTLFR